MSEDDKITYKEFKMWTEHLIKNIPVHKTAPETRDMVDSVKADFGEMKTSIKLLNSHFEAGGIVPRIEEHVKETNGKVALNSTWRIRLITGVGIVLFLFPIMTAVFGYFINDLKEDISDQITIQIEKNNKEVSHEGN